MEYKDCAYLKMCVYSNESGICLFGCKDYEKENANSGYPLLGDVLAEFEPMIFDFVESENDENVRMYLKNILSKYFS